MLLAFRNTFHDKNRLLVTVVGTAFAVFLMIFQGGLLSGFLRAASSVIDSTDADIWITAKGVPCLDFSSTFPDRYGDIAMGVPGVEQVRRFATGFALFLKPSGVVQTVLLVGGEPGSGKLLPIAYQNTNRNSTVSEAVLVDRSNAEVLGLNSFPAAIEIAGKRAIVPYTVQGFSSFIGSPYVFASYKDAKRYLRLKPEETVFLLVKVESGFRPEEVRDHIRTRLPNNEVWTKEEFAKRSQNYWIIQTGAGSAILTAAILGFVVGMVIVSQTIYASTMENIEEFATLKAMGASRKYIMKVVLIQAIITSMLGYVFGLVVTLPLVHLAARLIPWLYVPWWLPASMILASLLLCSLASIASIRKAISVEPGRVFRV